MSSPAPAAAAEPPDVSQLPPADAARTLGNWNYDRQNWPHAIEHYEKAIARGADNPDVRTDLGNCFRFLGQPEKALEQYQIAQKENPLHENSLSIRSAFSPTCCTTTNAPATTAPTSSRGSRKARGWRQCDNFAAGNRAGAIRPGVEREARSWIKAGAPCSVQGGSAQPCGAWSMLLHSLRFCERMNVAGRPYRTIWLKPDDERVVQLIDQRALPHRFVVEDVEDRRADGGGDTGKCTCAGRG